MKNRDRTLKRDIKRLEHLRRAHLDHGHTHLALETTRRIETARRQLRGRG